MQKSRYKLVSLIDLSTVHWKFYSITFLPKCFLCSRVREISNIPFPRACAVHRPPIRDAPLIKNFIKDSLGDR